MWNEIKRVIQENHRFFVTTHINPDGDGIGSSAALIELLLLMGKEAYFVCDSPIPKKFAFLDIHGFHFSLDSAHDIPKPEVLIVLDTHSLERIGKMAKFVQDDSVKTVCIDHHTLTNPLTECALIDDTASAVGTLIYTLFKECGYPLNLQAATGIYTSVICDTGRFSYSSTNRQAHKVADECINLGVDPDLMYSRLYQHVTLNQFKVFARSLQQMEVHFDDKVMIHPIYLTDYEKAGTCADEMENIDLEYILELNKQIEEVECVVLLREVKQGQVRISIRSKSELDIGELMRKMGGGGHSKAAGTLFTGTVNEAKDSILNQLKINNLFVN